MEPVISNEDFINAIIKIHDKYGYINTSILQKEKPFGDISYSYYLHKFNGIKQICKDYNLKYIHGIDIDKQVVLDKCIKIYKENGKITKEICNKNGVYNSVIKRLFGNWTNLYEEIGIEPNIQINATEEDVLEDVMYVYNKFGCISSNIYRKNGKYSQTITDRLFGTWSNIMNILGIEKFQHTLISYGEDFIYNILKTNNIDFHTEFTFDWLLSDTGNNMYIDFYIPSKNVAIEYDGMQHYKYVEYIHHTEENFHKSQIRDRLKEELLLEHGIKLIRIKYDVPLNDDLANYIITELK